MQSLVHLPQERIASSSLAIPLPTSGNWRILSLANPTSTAASADRLTPQMLVRFRQDVIDLHPKVVVILAGTNDIAGNTGPMRNEDIEANFASFTELARANGIRVVYSSVLPVHNYTDRSKDFFAQRPQKRILELNTWLKDYCARNKIVYLEYFSALVDEHGMLKKDLAEDGLHPNAAGYKIMAPLAEAAIQKAMK